MTRPAPATLVVVESPAKGLTLRRWLGPGWELRATSGHLLDLPRHREGIDLAGGFEPAWELVRGRGRALSELKRAARRAGRVLLATDPDREGEGIAWRLAAELGAEGGSPRIARVVLRELTPEAAAHGLASPVPLHRARAEAQQARRVLDRLVGWRLSARLSSALRPGLGAGRVQAAALRLAAAWRPGGDGGAHGGTHGAAFGDDSAREPDAEVAPFTTATLLAAAGRELGLRPARTMALAQRLYEGVDLGEGGRTGLVTYPRTFEAIRPTSLDWPPERARLPLRAAGGRDMARLYRLVWDRFVGLLEPSRPRPAARPAGASLDDAALLEALVRHGVGRPFTYAGIGENLVARGYLERLGPALAVTPLGRRVVAWLDRTFPRTLDAGFTALLEARLDEVEAGALPWRVAVASTWQPLETTLGRLVA